MRLEGAKFGLIGYPLGHTLSPFVHKQLFTLSNTESFSYDVMEIPPDKLETEIKNLNALCGYNITIPHKCEIIKYLDNIDPETAGRYGAVNCVLNKNGVSTGYNTDCFGFKKSLEQSGVSLSGKVLVLGFGGAGRMMAMEAKFCGADVTVAVRDTNKIPPEQKSQMAFCDINKIIGEFDLIINSTPVGMYPNIDGCPANDEVIKNAKAVFDAVYNPGDTRLLIKAKEHNITAIGGMAMLVWQAAVAHNIWYNADFRDKDISDIIKKAEEFLINMN